MASPKRRKIGILTGGGDCPGLNAVIRAVAKTVQTDYNAEVVGVYDSYNGLVLEQFKVLQNADVSGILNQGGTILGTARGNPFELAHERGLIDSPEENWDYVKQVMERHEIDGIVTVGGDGTQRVATRAHKAGIPIVAVPKTIDNDIADTDFTFGFNSAVSIVMNAIDMLHTTAMSHHRVMVLETMGRTVGWLALHAGVAGGGDIILLPEIPYDMDEVCERVVERSRVGKRFSILVVAEGARDARTGQTHRKGTDASGRELFRGIGQAVSDEIEEQTDLSTRVTVLGHLQRGGPPTAFDRLLATQFGHAAANLIMTGEGGQMVAYRDGKIEPVALEDATATVKQVPINDPLVQAARSVGTSFGD